MKVTVHKSESKRPIKALLNSNTGSLIFPTDSSLHDQALSVYISGVTSNVAMRYDGKRTLEEDLKLNPHFVPLYEGDTITITF